MKIKIHDGDIRESYPEKIAKLECDNNNLKRYLISRQISSAEINVYMDSFGKGFDYEISYDNKNPQRLSSHDLTALIKNSSLIK